MLASCLNCLIYSITLLLFPCTLFNLLTSKVRFSLYVGLKGLLMYANGIYFILGFSSCANWEEPQSWCPSESWKCGTRVWWLCSKIGRTLYILYGIQISRMTRFFIIWVIIAVMFLPWCNLDQLHKADRGAHNYYLEKGIVDIRPDHILNLIHYEVRMPLHL